MKAAVRWVLEGLAFVVFWPFFVFLLGVVVPAALLFAPVLCYTLLVWWKVIGTERLIELTLTSFWIGLVEGGIVVYFRRPIAKAFVRYWNRVTSPFDMIISTLDRW